VDLVVDSGDPAPALTVLSTVILTVIGGLLVGLDMDAAAVQTAHRVVAAARGLGAALAAPMAVVSCWRRGYLPGFVALLAVAVVTQIVTAIGAGAWFPPRRASAVDGHARRERRQPGVSNPAAATASRCSDRGCRDAQLVAARRGALTASGPRSAAGRTALMVSAMHRSTGACQRMRGRLESHQSGEAVPMNIRHCTLIE